jgi:outer membrane protein OmpA-like peptidoglycan-associated protein
MSRKTLTFRFTSLIAIMLFAHLFSMTLLADGTTTEIVRFKEGAKSTVQLKGVGPAVNASGTIKVSNRAGESKLSITVKDLPSPQTFGSFYTSYVLWSVLPEGPVATRLMSIPLKKAKNLTVTIPSQRWGLVVTAEPYPVVTEPSNQYAMVMTMSNSTRGIETKSVMPLTGAPNPLYAAENVSTLNHGNPPLPVLGARVAVEIARRAGAETYAESKYVLAVEKLGGLEEVWIKNPRRESAWAALALETDRLAQEARVSAIAAAEQARLVAEEVARQKAIAESEAKAAQAQQVAEDARIAEESARLQSEMSQMEAAQAQQDAEQARFAAEKAQLDAEQARLEVAETQARLQSALDAIMDTHREARGLVVSMSDVLFDFGKATLRPDAREGLAKIAGVLLAYPLPTEISIEGHTDSIGTDEYNLGLSQRRADAVRDYLIASGISPDMIVSTIGVGKANPIASNDTEEGRSRNRRVEIIIDDDLDD